MSDFSMINTEQKQMIKDCLNNKRYPLMREKEAAFVDTLNTALEATPPQIKWLEGIWNRVTTNG